MYDKLLRDGVLANVCCDAECGAYDDGGPKETVPGGVMGVAFSPVGLLQTISLLR